MIGFLEYVLDSAAEWHALLVGVTVGLSLGVAIALGKRAIVGFTLGALVGVTVALWYSGVLVYWPAHPHVWYLVTPAAVLAFLTAVLVIDDD